MVFVTFATLEAATDRSENSCHHHRVGLFRWDEPKRRDRTPTRDATVAAGHRPTRPRVQTSDRSARSRVSDRRATALLDGVRTGRGRLVRAIGELAPAAAGPEVRARGAPQGAE